MLTHTSLFKRAFFAIAFLTFGFTAQAAQINISWDDNSTNETGFEVWFSQGLGNTSFDLLSTVAANVTTYSHTNLPYTTVFNYKIRAINPASVPPESVFSNVATGTTSGDSVAPTAPTSVASSNVTSTSLALAWVASTDNVAVTGYRISRNGTVLKTVTTASTTDTGLTPATTYAYSIVALDAAGNTSTAATISVTTLPPSTPAAPSNVRAVVVP